MAFAIWLSRRREREGGDWRRPTQVALAAVVAYISLNAAVGLFAKRALTASGAANSPDALFASVEPVLFWKRELVWRENGRIGRAGYDPVSGPHKVEPAAPDKMDDPLVRRARADREVVAFLRWSVLPIASIKRSRCRALVSFGDARFGSPRVSARFLRTVILPVPCQPQMRRG